MWFLIFDFILIKPIFLYIHHTLQILLMQILSYRSQIFMESMEPTLAMQPEEVKKILTVLIEKKSTLSTEAGQSPNGEVDDNSSSQEQRESEEGEIQEQFGQGITLNRAYSTRGFRDKQPSQHPFKKIEMTNPRSMNLEDNEDEDEEEFDQQSPQLNNEEEVNQQIPQFVQNDNRKSLKPSRQYESVSNKRSQSEKVQKIQKTKSEGSEEKEPEQFVRGRMIPLRSL